jgi:hypothetical protein
LYAAQTAAIGALSAPYGLVFLCVARSALYGSPFKVLFRLKSNRPSLKVQFRKLVQTLSFEGIDHKFNTFAIIREGQKTA